MLKILHTADWHIGQSLNGWDREIEHRLWFSHLADLVSDLSPDAFFVCGDIFDGLNPSGESLALLYDTLADLKKRCPAMTIVISSGNHDPAARLEAPRSILSGLDVHVVSTLRGREGEIEIDRLLFPLPDRDGTVQAYALAIPFLRAADLPGLSLSAEGGGLDVVSATAALLDTLVTVCRRRIGPDLPLIGLAHMHCRNALESEGAERRILIGGEHAFPAERLPEGLSFLALGHIHRPQSVSDRARYSGSAFPLSAAEADYDHGVTLIEIEAGQILTRHISIEPPCPMLRLPARGTLRLEDLPPALDAAARSARNPEAPPPFVHVFLEADGPAAVLMAEAERLLEGHALRNAGIRILRSAIIKEDDPEITASIGEIQPEDLFAVAFRAANMVEPAPEHLAVFRDIVGGL